MAQFPRRITLFIIGAFAIAAAALVMLKPWWQVISPVDPLSLPVTTPLALRLRSHVEYLASPKLKGRKPGTPGNRVAGKYIEDEFRRAGLKPLPFLGGYTQQISPAIGDNVMGMQPAQSIEGAQRWILLGAHYDHLGELQGKIYFGADDNASSVAILIETAKTIALEHYSILFVAFNAEESPGIRTPPLGSQYFVDHLPGEIGSIEQIHLAIIMDLLGGVHWEPLRDVVFAVGAEQSPGLYRHIKELDTISDHGHNLFILPLGMHLIEEIPVIGQIVLSDYNAFRNASVPFLFLSAGRTPRYHEPSDRPETLYYERMALTVSWLESLLHAADADLTPYRFEPDHIEFSNEVATLRPIVTKASNWGTRIPGTSIPSLLRLKLDAKWLEQLSPGQTNERDIKRLEKISVRIQCLLADYYGCFLF
jgi:Zn-dependent M28 family amino/carboxypeptidase